MKSEVLSSVWNAVPRLKCGTASQDKVCIVVYGVVVIIIIIIIII
jgi:hypothetical protein